MFETEIVASGICLFAGLRVSVFMLHATRQHKKKTCFGGEPLG